MSNKRLAFVIMPFGEEFDAVYESFMKPVLEEAGFEVDRADDIESQQNILKDILDRIHMSDLIVADLTSANPNVFYELGVAHALRKSVILVTQSIEEAPFNLKSYRLLEYNTQFVEIEKAKQELSKYAKGFLEGKIQFGTPVTDHHDKGMESARVTDVVPHDTAPEDDRGFIDHLIDINDGYSRIADIIAGVTADLQNMSESVEGASEDFTRIGAKPSSSSPAAARAVSRRLAERIATFNSRLKQANAKYASVAQDTEDSLEFVVSFQLEQSKLEDPEVAKQLSSLESLRSVAIEGRNSFLNMADSMNGLPRLERRLNREVVRGSEEVRTMASNIDKTIGSISRALKDYK